jgi:hypothetical protein
MKMKMMMKRKSTRRDDDKDGLYDLKSPLRMEIDRKGGRVFDCLLKDAKGSNKKRRDGYHQY